MSKLSKVIKTCERCGNSYHPRSERIKTSRYCCFECTKKPRITKKCVVCNSDYQPLVYRQDQSRFCSRKCQKLLKGPEHFLYGARDKPWSYVPLATAVLQKNARFAENLKKDLIFITLIRIKPISNFPTFAVSALVATEKCTG